MVFVLITTFFKTQNRTKFHSLFCEQLIKRFEGCPVIQSVRCYW
ncbi:unnamed protein product [Brassica oleracea]